jgi:hypothetical protein
LTVSDAPLTRCISQFIEAVYSLVDVSTASSVANGLLHHKPHCCIRLQFLSVGRLLSIEYS